MLRNNLTGKRFGRLQVIGRSDKPNKKVIYECLCDCGKVKHVQASALTNGATKSCGCLQRETASKLFSKEDGFAGLNAVYKNYKRHAVDRNLEFAITLEQFSDIASKNCYYCNAAPNNRSKPVNSRVAYIYNGIDRKDNTKGYVLDNIVPCCRKCNGAKSDMSYQEFLEWIRKVYEHNNT